MARAVLAQPHIWKRWIFRGHVVPLTPAQKSDKELQKYHTDENSTIKLIKVTATPGTSHFLLIV